MSDITSSTIIARWEVSNISSAVYILQVRELDSRSIHYTEHEWLSWEHILKVSLNPLPIHFLSVL